MEKSDKAKNKNKKRLSLLCVIYYNGLKNFNFAAFTEEHKISIPPKELSLKFNSLIEPIYKEIANIGFEIEHLNCMLGYILPRMMSVGF